MSKGKKPERENVIGDPVVWFALMWARMTSYAKDQHDLELPQDVDFSDGFTMHGKTLASKLEAQAIFREATIDGRTKVIVRFRDDFDTGVVETIAKLVPQLLNGKPDRDARCRDLAIRWGLDVSDGGLRGATLGRRLREFTTSLNEELGPYPRKGVRYEVLNEKRSQVATNASAKQRGRSHKVACDKCGLIVRQSQGSMDDWGIALCPEHGKMTVHYKEGEEPDAVGEVTSEMADAALEPSSDGFDAPDQPEGAAVDAPEPSQAQESDAPSSAETQAVKPPKRREAAE